MKRKVIKLNPSTVAVSLPVKWVREQGVKKKDELEVDVSNSILTIKAVGARPEEKKIEIELKTGPKRYIISHINNLYREGYDEIRINFDDIKIVEIIKEAVENTLGYEIIEQKEKNCVIKNVAGIFEGEFDNLIRREFLVLLSMADDSLEEIQNLKVDLEKFRQLKRTVEKLMNSCCRILNKGDRKCSPKSKFIYLIVYTLEKITNEYLYIVRYVQENNVKFDKALLEHYQEVNTYLRLLY
ncbi:AbrB/MazE/SpoVT family DNA-binding domain-containing protein, partial [Thermoproteota archaeon]